MEGTGFSTSHFLFVSVKAIGEKTETSVAILNEKGDFSVYGINRDGGLGERWGVNTVIADSGYS